MLGGFTISTSRSIGYYRVARRARRRLVLRPSDYDRVWSDSATMEALLVRAEATAEGFTVLDLPGFVGSDVEFDTVEQLQLLLSELLTASADPDYPRELVALRALDLRRRGDALRRSCRALSHGLDALHDFVAAPG